MGPEKKNERGCIGGIGNAAGCLFIIALILGSAIYIAVQHPELAQEFMSWIKAQQ